MSQIVEFFYWILWTSLRHSHNERNYAAQMIPFLIFDADLTSTFIVRDLLSARYIPRKSNKFIDNTTRDKEHFRSKMNWTLHSGEGYSYGSHQCS